MRSEVLPATRDDWTEPPRCIIFSFDSLYGFAWQPRPPVDSQWHAQLGDCKNRRVAESASVDLRSRQSAFVDSSVRPPAHTSTGAVLAPLNRRCSFTAQFPVLESHTPEACINQACNSPLSHYPPTSCLTASSGRPRREKPSTEHDSNSLHSTCRSMGQFTAWSTAAFTGSTPSTRLISSPSSKTCRCLTNKPPLCFVSMELRAKESSKATNGA
ncbi:hypothetical protein B0T14DRAFT_22888 [Immersiella caudata]|uniref:Uncharacterized protein n=1 Tax=Immersiella caudata TaxID=314043 RepID=A0AA39XDW2_9PEZI|nr:hypothetical protein B0T14DRAFT_22888 [Immersiella caudata]